MSGSITSSTISCGLKRVTCGDRLGAGPGRLDGEALEAQGHRDDVDDVRLVVDDEHAVGVWALAHADTIVADAVSFLGAAWEAAAQGSVRGCRPSDARRPRRDPRHPRRRPARAGGALGALHADPGPRGARHAREVQPGRDPRGRPAARPQRARAQPGDVGERGVLPAARREHRRAGEGLAGLVGRAPREPARGPFDARPGQGGGRHAAAAVRLLPRLSRRPGRDRPLPAHPRRRGRLRPRVGDAHGGRGPAARRPARERPRREGGARRPLARRLDHDGLRDVGLRGQAGRERPLGPGLHRRRQPPRPDLRRPTRTRG